MIEGSVRHRLACAAKLFVAGEGLAAGYLNQPDLTAAKFVAISFSDRPAARMYKTGDTVKYREDGNIEYIGRYDEQVKLRGFRLDLGDIESVLVQHPSGRDVKVALREDGSQEASLVAYLVVSQDLKKASCRTQATTTSRAWRPCHSGRRSGTRRTGSRVWTATIIQHQRVQQQLHRPSDSR